MKLSLLCLCLVHLAVGGSGLFTRNDLQAVLSESSQNRTPGSHGPGSSNQGRVRPLFARRGQYERQRIHMPKSKAIPAAPKSISLPAKAELKPMKPTCSQLTQSCLPVSGCCDVCATCHCRFFNAICFCRKVKSLYEKKTHNSSMSKKGTKMN